MSPASGRFAQQDTFAGSSDDPATLHKYLYASAGPINGTDPSGNLTLGQLATSSAIGATLSSIATVVGNHALGRPTTVGDIVSASVIGAALGPLAAANATAAVGIGIISATSSSFLLKKVFQNPDSTFFQKTEAVALVASSIFGLKVGLAYYRAGGRVSEPPSFPLKMSAPEEVVLETQQGGLRADKIEQIPGLMKTMIEGGEIPAIGGYKSGNRYVISEGHHRLAAALGLFKNAGNPKYVLDLLKAGRWDSLPPGMQTTQIATN